jgi:hypothetical protein
MITLTKHHNDPYGYYDQHGTRYFFMSHKEVVVFLRQAAMDFLTKRCL